MLWEGSWKGPQGIWKANVELGSSCKVMLMVIACVSLIPMDWVEKHPWQGKRSPAAKGLPGGQRLHGVLELAGLGNVPTTFSGKALLIQTISDDLPTSRGKPPLTMSASHALPATSQRSLSLGMEEFGD